MKVNTKAVSYLHSKVDKMSTLEPPTALSLACLNEKEIREELDDEILGLKDPSDFTSVEKHAQEIMHEAYSSKNKKVMDMYTKYQKMWAAFATRNKLILSDLDRTVEDGLVTFFHELENEKKYKASTLWVVYSCINSWFQEKYRKNLNEFVALRKYLKQKTGHYVANKAAVFTPEQIHELVVRYSESADPQQEVKAMTILVAYYGLLRKCDILKIMKKDVTFNERENCYEVNFPYERKRKNSGLTYLIPAEYNDYMSSYIETLVEAKPGAVEARFLRNWNKRGCKRFQNLGHSMIGKFPKEMAVDLGIDPTHFSTHSWRRSGATNLADGGCSLANLKRHGQWKSSTVAEGYIANSRPLKLQKVNLLKPEHLRTEEKEVVPYVPPQVVQVSPEAKKNEEEKVSVSGMNNFTNCTVVINYGAAGSSNMA